MRLHQIFEKYSSDIEFMLIYIREAHPNDKWWLGETKFMRVVARIFNNYASYDTLEPETIAERRKVAFRCGDKLLKDMPVFVDNMDNKVGQQYVGWPTRVYFVDDNGRVVFESGPGPFGQNHDVLDKEIAAYLQQT